MIPDQIKPPVLVLCGLLPASASILPWADSKKAGEKTGVMTWYDMSCPQTTCFVLVFPESLVVLKLDLAKPSCDEI